MSATAARASTGASGASQNGAGEEQGAAFRVDALGGAGLLFVDSSLRSLLIAEARRRVITRAFGTPRGEQSLLVTLILIGAAARVLQDAVPGSWPRPRRGGVAIGGALLNAALRSVAGAPAQGMPLAGALIAIALPSRSLRPAVAGSAGEVRAMARAMGAAFGARYAHRSAASVPGR
jgi:hypothetical protein